MVFQRLRSFIRTFVSAFGDTPELALRRFQLHSEQLQDAFYQRAANSGKPRGLRWVQCDWLPEQKLVRETSTGLLTLLVAVNISFEAVEGGDMEDVAAVGDIRDASAVFHYKDGRWGTGGRALFNMPPSVAAARLVDSFEPVQLAGQN